MKLSSSHHEILRGFGMVRTRCTVYWYETNVARCCLCESGDISGSSKGRTSARSNSRLRSQQSDRKHRHDTVDMEYPSISAAAVRLCSVNTWKSCSCVTQERICESTVSSSGRAIGSLAGAAVGQAQRVSMPTSITYSRGYTHF